MGVVAPFFENFRIEYASLTPRPRIRSSTSRTLRGLMPMFRAMARAFMVRLSPGSARLGALVDELAAVPLEGARRGELAELVSHHLLGEVDGDELVAVVHRQRVADEVGRDGGAARPGLQHAPLPLLVHRPDFLLEALLYEGPLLQASGHSFL